MVGSIISKKPGEEKGEDQAGVASSTLQRVHKNSTNELLVAVDAGEKLYLSRTC